ncbi:hypothetical protein [Kitasatospora sp. NPDC008115]|uniref:hypothetical protein n=1 Tax=Kitasatospora sp. NPDC008115 TaxID=3364022 RepID=UPI0036E1A253
MPIALRCLIVGVTAAAAAWVVVAVHDGGRMPLLPALCVDVFVGIAWLSVLALAVPRRRPADGPADDGIDLAYRTAGEPRAIVRWRARHWS